ncbi:MAG TPA: hypothetical protein VLN59_01950 [Burkholderiales bacterium]|nr:hypothetical protein [Burkholderiales bacterium]
MPIESDAKPAKRSPAEVLATVLDLIAEEEPDTEPTDDDRLWAREQHAKMQARIAEMRRQHTPSRPVIDRAVPIGPEIRALPREIVLARLEQLSQGGAVQYAHHELVGLTDDDLRQLLAVLLSPEE